MSQIMQVGIQSFQCFFHGVRVAIVQDSIGSGTRPDLVKIGILGTVLYDLVDVEPSSRLWSDEGHVSFDYVP